ncbi:MAG TPA: DUF2231 domain-containing protein, partial [Verrucomicrobiae bacterium]|nr:DUF2231 domain-containing protein [Verrucomicrobiae bacterium]
MPDPLHPAIIHFPVVLILLGSFAACAAVFWRKHYVPLLAAVLLAMGALGALVAVQTGKYDGGLVMDLSPQAELLLDAHQNWAERTLTLAAIAAVVAVASVGLFSFPRAARAVAVAAALFAGAASYSLYQTGHRGGALVFRHGIGVDITAPTTSGEGTAGKLTSQPVSRDTDRE